MYQLLIVMSSTKCILTWVHIADTELSYALMTKGIIRQKSQYFGGNFGLVVVGLRAMQRLLPDRRRTTQGEGKKASSTDQ
jgi:hypothetical protein